MKKQIRLALEALDVSDVDNTLLVVKLGNTYNSEDLVAIQDAFYQVLKDMDKKLRVAFVPEGTNVCLKCPRAEKVLKNAITEDKELIKGNKDI